jgi:hypothetical protein|nr:hypothetical protein [Neorhizobium tomejilense]
MTTMKLTMEIQGLNTGQSNRRSDNKLFSWTSVWGNDTNNRHAYAKVYGAVAEALNAKIASMLDQGEVVSSKRLVVTMEGQWKAEEFEHNGKRETKRIFYGTTFEILDGPALESARLRRDAVSALRKAEELRKAGQLALAYEATAQFVANFAGVPLDLDEFLSASAAEEAEFGAVATSEHNPEAIAAAHFAREDETGRKAQSVKDLDAEPQAPTVAEEEAQAMERVDVGSEEEVQDFGPNNDPELGAVGEVDEIREEDAISLDSAPALVEDDVLDDASAAAGPAREERKASPSFATRGPAPFQRPGASSASSAPFAPSKPFGRPEITREAPQPSARLAPVEEVQNQPRPAPSSVPAFLRGR